MVPGTAAIRDAAEVVVEDEGIAPQHFSATEGGGRVRRSLR